MKPSRVIIEFKDNHKESFLCPNEERAEKLFNKKVGLGAKSYKFYRVGQNARPEYKPKKCKNSNESIPKTFEEFQRYVDLGLI